MKHTTTLLVVGLLATLATRAPEARAEPSGASASKDIVATALAAGDFKILAQALTSAQLVEALQGEGPFTVFAPTDEAFGRLPDGTVASLLEDSQRDRLRSILLYHVVSGRVASTDLLSTREAKTLSGDAVPFGLRVGNANVIQADILCSNGVIHVIDNVLLPPERPQATTPERSVRGTIVQAIERGAPLYNDGHIEACVAIYETAAQTLLTWAVDELSSSGREELSRAMASHSKDGRERAWALRRAFDAILSEQTFEPIVEASLPEGFPGPGPLNEVVLKRYPRYRAARAEGGNSFWTLFRHIKKNGVEMTAPVEMTLGDDMRSRDMAFLYESPDQGSAGQQGSVAVLDLAPLKVLSIGMRGSRDTESLQRAKTALEARLQADGWQRAGDYRVLGYNSPMIPASKRFWELQVPVSR
jgi:uncharacterized surface protein with fasciclin (FAS1) repeats